MKFSKLEQQEIKKLCEWAITSNKFYPLRNFYSNVGLESGHGIICFSEGHKEGPLSILVANNNQFENGEIFDIQNHYRFSFSLILKKAYQWLMKNK